VVQGKGEKTEMRLGWDYIVLIAESRVIAKRAIKACEVRKRLRANESLMKRPRDIGEINGRGKRIGASAIER
jgi:hypothetical protein